MHCSLMVEQSLHTGSVESSNLSNASMKRVTLNKKQLLKLCGWGEVIFYDYKYSRTLFNPDDAKESSRFELVFYEDEQYIQLEEYDTEDGYQITVYSGMTDCKPFTVNMFCSLMDLLS